MFVIVREYPGTARNRYRIEFKERTNERPIVINVETQDRLRSLLEKKAKLRTGEVNRLIGALDGNPSAPVHTEQCDLDGDELRTLVRSLRDEEIVEQQAAEKAVK